MTLIELIFQSRSQLIHMEIWSVQRLTDLTYEEQVDGSGYIADEEHYYGTPKHVQQGVILC